MLIKHLTPFIVWKLFSTERTDIEIALYLAGATEKCKESKALSILTARTAWVFLSC